MNRTLLGGVAVVALLGLGYYGYQSQQKPAEEAAAAPAAAEPAPADPAPAPAAPAAVVAAPAAPPTCAQDVM